MRVFVSSFALLAISSAVLFAQGERGALNGTITDPNGASVPGAAVSARNIDTGIEIKAVTTDAGVYRLSALPAGNYRISATAKGFRTSVAERVDLAVAQTMTVDLKLELGQVSEQVTVSSEAPLIETGTAEIGRYVTEKEFDTWPICGWRWTAADPVVHFPFTARDDGRRVPGLHQRRPTVLARNSCGRHGPWALRLAGRQ